MIDAPAAVTPIANGSGSPNGSFGHHFANISIESPGPGREPATTVQPFAGVTLSQPGDAFEQEAEAVADVISGEDKSAPNRPRVVDQRRPRVEVMRHVSPSGQGDGQSDSHNPEAGGEIVPHGPGEPLDQKARDALEPRFGHDFGHVRVHTDERAAQSAEALTARAYTVGSDIVFGAGQYEPGTLQGRKLLAHELTHTLQQQRRPSDLVQREPKVSSAPSTSPASAPPMTPAPPGGTAPTPTALKTVTYQGKEIYGVPDTAKQMLQHLITTEGYKSALDFVDKLVTVSRLREEDFQGVFKGQDQEAAKLCVKTTVEQRPAIVKDRDDELERFEVAARAKTNIILGESEKRINDERKRYGIPEQQFVTDREGQTEVSPHTMENNDETKAMAAAAGELVPSRKSLEALLKRYDGCLESTANNNQAPGMPAKRVIVGKEEEAQNLDVEIKEARRQVDVIRAAKERLFPILAVYGPEGEEHTASLENIAKGTASQGLAFWRKNATDELVPMVHEKLNNIAKVRMALLTKDLKIWSHATIVSGTKAELGYNPSTWQTRVVDDKVKEVHDDELLVNLLVGALAIGLGLVAIFATAGTATAAVAAGGSAVLSGGQAAVTLGNYLQANAESGTDFDKTKAISQEDPSLFWLAVDIVAAGLDMKAAVSSFRVLAHRGPRGSGRRQISGVPRQARKDSRQVRPGHKAEGSPAHHRRRRRGSANARSDGEDRAGSVQSTRRRRTTQGGRGHQRGGVRPADDLGSAVADHRVR